MRVRNMIIAIAGLALLGSIASVQAQTSKGDFEASGQAYFVSPSGSDEVFTVNGSFGYFITDNISVLGSAFIFSAAGEIAGTVGPAADYYFNPASDTVFFAGGSLQIGLGDNADTSLEAHVGAKHFLTERVTLNGQLGQNDALDGQYALFGISYFF